jgi:pimeloyl-ACP methyl ester carboxylesterase
MHKVLSSDGTEIAYDRVGDGPAILVVSAAFGDRTADAPLAALLAPKFTVYTYDRRGHGSSGDIEPFDPNREYEDVEAVIAEAGGAVSVYGSSSGGILALEAVARGLSISRVAVWEPPFVIKGSRPPLPVNYRERLETMLAEGRRRDMMELFVNEVALFPPEAAAWIREAPQWSRLEASVHTLIYDAQLNGDYSMPVKRLAQTTVPTLVINGDMVPWLTHAADALAAVLPDARRLSLPGQPHMVAPEAVAPALIDFFAG